MFNGYVTDMMHPEDQSFRESGEFAMRMHNSWAKHNLTFKFHVLAGPFPPLPPLRPALRRALIIGYLVITGDTFFLVARYRPEFTAVLY